MSFLKAATHGLLELGQKAFKGLKDLGKKGVKGIKQQLENVTGAEPNRSIPADVRKMADFGQESYKDPNARKDSLNGYSYKSNLSDARRAVYIKGIPTS